MSGGRIDILVAPSFDGFEGKLRSGLSNAGGLAGTLGKGIGAAIVAGTAVAAVGLKNVIDLGISYQNSLNTLQSVTHATGLEMAQVGALSKALGADLTLPATSAADAAAAMTELAKGGLSVSEAMTAAKGTLQLAAAAQIDAAQAATIQSDALNQFGLAASEAGHVADLLANTANAASGEITDMAGALKFVGPVAKALGADIDSVSTAIGLLATQGIRGEQAGTSLRGIIASLSAPSKEAAKALQDLGVKAFDQTGKFVGLRTVTEQLAAAKGRMTEAEFAAAAATAFGNEGLTAASALASSGATAFDNMATAVTKSGGAAEVAAAKTKGLGGAWEGFKSQLETTGIGIFEAIDGPLENAVRSAARFVDQFDDVVIRGIENAVAAGSLFGPQLAAALSERAGVVQAAVGDILSPLASGAVGPLNEIFNAVIRSSEDFTAVLGNVADAAKPVAVGIGDLASASSEGGGALSTLGAGVGVATDALRIASGILGPVGSLIGGLVEGFASLPGPVQSAVVALVAFRIAQRALGDTQALSTLRQFSGEMAVQRGLAQQDGESVGRLGSAMAAFNTSTIPAVAAARGFRDQTVAIRDGAAAAGQPIGVMSAALGTLVERSPALSAMRASFEGASQGATRFGTAAGIAAAAGTGLKSAASGLVSALGGPFGIAIAAASLGLSFLAKSQEEAAQKAAEHNRQLSDLQTTLDQTSGSVTRQTREWQANKNASEGVNDAAKRQKIALDDLLNAQTGSASAIAKVNDELRTGARAFVESNDAAIGLEKSLRGAGISFGDLTEVAVGNQAALSKVQAAIAAVQGTAKREGLADLLKDLQKGSADFSKLGGSIGGANDNLKKAVQNILEAKQALGDSSPFTARLAAGMGVLGSEASSAAQRVSALKDALDLFSGGQIALTAAQSAFNRTLGSAKEQFQLTGDAAHDAAIKANGWGDAIIDASGKLNTTTKNGQDFEQFLGRSTTDMLGLANATLDVSKANNDKLSVSFAKVRDSAQASREEIIKVAVSNGIAKESIEKYLDSIGLIPSVVATRVTTGGTAPAVQQEVINVQTQLQGLPKDTPVHVSALTQEAKDLLADLGYRIETIPNGGFNVSANTNPAQSSIDKLIRDNTGKVIGIRVEVQGVPGVKIGGPNIASHDGNLLRAAAFASGGMARKLTPMPGGIASIIPPNTWRIVGDRMKDDEAYIPINRSQRSVAILNQTAQQMGFNLTRMWAAGGIAAQTASITSAITSSMSSSAGGFAPVITINAPGATPAAIRMLEQSTIPKLRMLLVQQVGRKIGG